MHPSIHHLIIMPDKVEELRKVAVYLCSRMSQAIRIFSDVCFLSLAVILFSCLWQSCRCFPAPGSEFFALGISASGASVLLAQRWSERKRGDHSGSQMRARVLFSLFKIRRRSQLGSEPNFFFLPFSSSDWLKLVWEQNTAEQPVLVGRLLCRRSVGLSEGYPSRAL